MVVRVIERGSKSRENGGNWRNKEMRDRIRRGANPQNTNSTYLPPIIPITRILIFSLTHN
jgi:hypothetical protein